MRVARHRGVDRSVALTGGPPLAVKSRKPETLALPSPGEVAIPGGNVAPVIAAWEAIATGGAFGELKGKGGRAAASSRSADVSRRGASRESRGAPRLTRAARAETTTLLAVASTVSLVALVAFALLFLLCC